MPDINVFPHVDTLSDSVLLLAYDPSTGLTGNFTVGELKTFIGATGGGNPPTQNYADLILLDSPTGYWKLDEKTGTQAVDSSGNNLNGTYNGSYLLEQTSPKSGGVSFDGGYVKIAGNPALNLSGAFAVEFWFKLSNNTQQQKYLLGKEGNAYAVIYNYAAGMLEFFSGGSVDFRSGSQIPMNDTEWHHLVYDYDASDFRGFLDGVLVFETPKNLNLPVTNDSLIIGGTFSGGATGLVQAKMAHVVLYDKSIADRVAAHFNG